MGRIVVKDAVKRYGKKVALKGVSFEVGDGELFAYIGPNGAGKTTTVKALLGIITLDGGEARILSDKILAGGKDVGFVLEDELPFESLTPYEYLRFYAEVYGGVSDGRIEEMLKKMGLWDDRKRRIKGFSNGMKRKLCLAKALIASPSVVLLDEPTQGIEVDTRKQIRELLVEYARNGGTVFITTHNLYEIETICTSFGVIMDGEFLGKWNKGELGDKSLEDFYMELKRGREYVDAH